MIRTKLVLLAVTTALATPALAQGAFEIDEIVITPNRAPTDPKRTGAAVSVLDEEALETLGDVSAASALSTIPGVTVTNQGPFGNSSSVRIRGADGRYLAVYVDGVRVSDPSSTQTAFNFGSLLATDISRVEVLRGSQSALYGGSAVGGVISLTTRRATEEGITQDIAVEAGSFGSGLARYTYTQNTGDVETALSLSHYRTDGFSAASVGTERDGADASRLSFSSRFRLTDQLTMGLSGFYQQTEQEYDGFDATFTLTDLDNVQDKTEAGGRIFAEFSVGQTEHVVDLTAYSITRDFDQEGAFSSFEGDRIGFSWQATTAPAPNLAFVYGADTMNERARYSNIATGIGDTRISGAFAQALWAPNDRLDISATARIDRNSDFGSFDTVRGAVAWRPTDRLTVRAAAATGFRAPSIDERFGDYPGFFPFVGNPDLTPEESESYELGVEAELGAEATLAVTAFRLNIDNLITFQSGTPSTLVNVPGASVRQGAELATKFPIGGAVTVQGSYTYIDATRPSGVRLGGVPRHDLSLTVEAALSDRLSTALRVAHAADRLDDFGSAAMPDYTVVDASVSYDLNEDAQLYLRVENLFDEDYELSDGYATSDRAVYVGFRRTF